MVGLETGVYSPIHKGFGSSGSIGLTAAALAEVSLSVVSLVDPSSAAIGEDTAAKLMKSRRILIKYNI